MRGAARSLEGQPQKAGVWRHKRRHSQRSIELLVHGLVVDDLLRLEDEGRTAHNDGAHLGCGRLRGVTHILREPGGGALLIIPLEYLREETELTLQSAGNTCLVLEKIIDELKQSKGITHELSS